jgi:hypothetical protein
MATRIFLTGLAILALMFAVKDGRFPHVAGLTGYCTVVQTAADGSQLDACRSGRLEGAPNLSSHGCTQTGIAAGYAYWRCPAPVVASPVGR